MSDVIDETSVERSLCQNRYIYIYIILYIYIYIFIYTIVINEPLIAFIFSDQFLFILKPTAGEVAPVLYMGG